MNILRNHWFDLGLGLAVITSVYLVFTPMNSLALWLWISLITLFLHQFEEYRYPGYFPGMLNRVMFASQEPDRYPLNSNTALIINVSVGWLLYFLAAILAEKALWLGIATILVSAGNIIAHSLLFNIKGKTYYTPGMLTADLLFLPVVIIFFVLVIQGHLAGPLDWIAGILLGIALNYLGVLKLIDLLKNKKTRYIFSKRFIAPESKENGN